jgi:hypothetical protein
MWRSRLLAFFCKKLIHPSRTIGNWMDGQEMLKKDVKEKS